MLLSYSGRNTRLRYSWAVNGMGTIMCRMFHSRRWDTAPCPASPRPCTLHPPGNTPAIRFRPPAPASPWPSWTAPATGPSCYMVKPIQETVTSQSKRVDAQQGCLGTEPAVLNIHRRQGRPFRYPPALQNGGFCIRDPARPPSAPLAVSARPVQNRRQGDTSVRAGM